VNACSTLQKTVMEVEMDAQDGATAAVYSGEPPRAAAATAATVAATVSDAAAAASKLHLRVVPALWLGGLEKTEHRQNVLVPTDQSRTDVGLWELQTRSLPCRPRTEGKIHRVDPDFGSTLTV
jgi:hypothetical protein